MFCLITSSKLSRQLFEFSLKVKVMGSNLFYFNKIRKTQNEHLKQGTFTQWNCDCGKTKTTKADIEKRALIPTHLVLPNVKTRVHCTFRWPKSIIFLDNFMHITNTVLSRHEFSTNDYG